jgi:hypothetical protein
MGASFVCIQTILYFRQIPKGYVAKTSGEQIQKAGSE